VRHLTIYESFYGISQKGRDLFGMEFKKILHNRTVITGPIYNEEKIEELFSERNQSKLIDACYLGWRGGFTLNNDEIKRAEHAEKNIKGFIGNKLEELECLISYYHPMYIDTVYQFSPIKVYAPGASWDSENYLKIERTWGSRYSEKYYEILPEIINRVKEFASRYKVTHVLPHGPRIVDYALQILQNPKDDVEKRASYGTKEPVFTPIEKFKWESYYW